MKKKPLVIGFHTEVHCQGLALEGRWMMTNPALFFYLQLTDFMFQFEAEHNKGALSFF